MSTPQDPNQPGQPYGQQPPHGQQPQYNQPYPPQQPPKKRKKWPWILLAIVVIIIIASVAGGGDDDKKASVTPGGGNSGQGAEAAPENGITWPGKADDDTGANAGDSVNLDDVVSTSSPLEFVANEYSPGDYCTNVSITNNTEKNQSFNLFDWTLLDPTGTIRNPTIAIDRPALNSGETAPGGTTTGAVCFDAPTGQAPGTYVVLFEKAFSFTSDKIGWVNTL